MACWRFRSNAILRINPDRSAGPSIRSKEIRGDSVIVGWLPDRSGGVEVDQKVDLL